MHYILLNTYIPYTYNVRISSTSEIGMIVVTDLKTNNGRFRDSVSPRVIYVICIIYIVYTHMTIL